MCLVGLFFTYINDYIYIFYFIFIFCIFVCVYALLCFGTFLLNRCLISLLYLHKKWFVFVLFLSGFVVVFIGSVFAVFVSPVVFCVLWEDQMPWSSQTQQPRLNSY